MDSTVGLVLYITCIVCSVASGPGVCDDVASTTTDAKTRSLIDESLGPRRVSASQPRVSIGDRTWPLPVTIVLAVAPVSFCLLSASVRGVKYRGPRIGPAGLVLG